MFTTPTAHPSPSVAPGGEKDPWPALFALCLGFFMILVDSTIASLWCGLTFTPRQGLVGGGALPDAARALFSQAMATTMLLPPAVLVVGLVAALCFERPRHAATPQL